MTDEYTPTTEDVREDFIYGHQDIYMYGYAVVPFDEAKARWERWLASVKAEAWDEGYDAAPMGGRPRQENPYRKETPDG